MRPIRNRVCSVTKTPAKGSRSRENLKVQDPVEVFCRIRPLPDPSETGCISLYSSTKLGLSIPNIEKTKLVYYTFSHIFTEHADQKEIFNHIAMPLLNGIIKGENGLLFSYGVTGSGKTHTMSGEPNNPGIVPRCVNTIFNSIGNNQSTKFLIKSDKLNGFEVQSDSEALMERLQEAKLKRKNNKNKINDSDHPVFMNDGTKLDDIDDNRKYTIFISYIEIYNNNAYDLLDENAGTRSLQSKILREDSRRNVYINGVVEIEVKSANEAHNLYLMGNNKKRMGTTCLNSESSRSHSIFTIRLVISPHNVNDSTDKNSLIISQLSLVDLAGSERCSRTNTKGARLKEAGSINNSLMTLRTCLEILRENQQTGQNKMVPYRESRLTQLFKNYFEGEGKVKMIVCVNPSLKDHDETVHVMKFAEMTQEVKVCRPEVKVGKEVKKDKSDSLKNYDELQQLRATLRKNRQSVPKVTIISSESDEIKNLILYLKRRQQCLLAPKAVKRLSDKFRTRLVQVQDINDKYEKEFKHLLPAEREKQKSLKNKLVDMGYELDKAMEQCREKDKLIEQLEILNNEKDFKIRQTVINKQQQKKKMEEVSERMTHELDARLRRQREYLSNQMKEQIDKIDFARDVLGDKISPETVYKMKSAKTDILTDKVFSETNSKTKETRSSESRYEQDENVPPCNTPRMSEERRSQEHVSRKGTPVANVRYRRSRSANEIWLEHRPANPIPLGTVFQPYMKTRKSVTKLTNMKDVVNPKQSKYLLVDQTADEVGDLETKLYKGDIIPTCGGGAQVIFDDIEKLKQESPSQQTGSPKKNLRRVYPNSGTNGTSVAEKCSVGIEGHSNKKLKK